MLSVRTQLVRICAAHPHTRGGQEARAPQAQASRPPQSPQEESGPRRRQKELLHRLSFCVCLRGSNKESAQICTSTSPTPPAPRAPTSAKWTSPHRRRQPRMARWGGRVRRAPSSHQLKCWYRLLLLEWKWNSRGSPVSNSRRLLAVPSPSPRRVAVARKVLLVCQHCAVASHLSGGPQPRAP